MHKGGQFLAMLSRLTQARVGVLSEDTQMLLEVLIGNHMLELTLNTGGCSTIEMVRRYQRLPVFSKFWVLCILSFE